jgi:hypothetical protein
VNSSRDPISKITRAKCTSDVARSPEFKSQSHQKTKPKQKKFSTESDLPVSLFSADVTLRRATIWICDNLYSSLSTASNLPVPQKVVRKQILLVIFCLELRKKNSFCLFYFLMI